MQIQRPKVQSASPPVEARGAILPQLSCCSAESGNVSQGTGSLAHMFREDDLFGDLNTQAASGMCGITIHLMVHVGLCLLGS